MPGLGLFIIGALAALASVATLLAAAVAFCIGRRRVAVRCVSASGLLALAVVAGMVVDDHQNPPSVREQMVRVPRTIDGIAFPSGSTVVTETAAPDHVVEGRLPAATMVAGLLLVGEFTKWPGGPVERGELAAAARLDTVPCGPGPFRRHPDGFVACTLAEPLAVQGATLAAGHAATVRPGRDGALPLLRDGTLAEPAALDGLACAPGPAATEGSRSSCVLADDQEVGGFWLMGGTKADFYRRADGGVVLQGGAVLARPLDLFGVVLPRGSRLFEHPDLTLEEVREGRMRPHHEISFRTPADAVIPIMGAEIRGRLLVGFKAERIGIGTAYADDNGVLILDGRRMHGATFDRTTQAWRTD